MFVYEKKLQYPVRIQNPNPKLAAIIITQYGGPDGELGASLRYLSQRFSMPYPELKGLLTDIGTEEYVPLPWKSLRHSVRPVRIVARFFHLGKSRFRSQKRNRRQCEHGRRFSSFLALLADYPMSQSHSI